MKASSEAGTFASKLAWNLALTELRAAAKKELPVDVRQTVMRFYDCCANINKEDNSTLNEHRLSTRHFRNVLWGNSKVLSKYTTNSCVPA